MTQHFDRQRPVDLARMYATQQLDNHLADLVHDQERARGRHRLINVALLISAIPGGIPLVLALIVLGIPWLITNRNKWRLRDEAKSEAAELRFLGYNSGLVEGVVRSGHDGRFDQATINEAMAVRRRSQRLAKVPQ